MTISIVGCGWFGFPFGKALVRLGHHVQGSTASPEKLSLLESEQISPYLINLTDEGSSSIDPVFFNCDVIVISIPPKTKEQPGGRYLQTLSILIEYIRTHKVRKVIYISSTGVYGETNAHVDERTDPVPSSLSGQTLLDAEKLFRYETSFKTTIVRFGGLIGPGRDPGNFFAGRKNIPNGLAPVNLIHLLDCVGICLTIIKKNAFGHIINACAPDHPTRKDFYTGSAAEAGKNVPEFIDELSSWKIVESVEVGQLLGYEFPPQPLEMNR